MKIVKLTDTNGRVILVNPKFFQYTESYSDGKVRLYFRGELRSFLVKETVEEIERILNEQP